MLGHGDPVKPVGWDDLDDEAPDERKGSDSHTDTSLLGVERNSSKRASSKLDRSELNHPHECIDEEEEPVVEKIGENVELAFAKLASVDHVEELHHNECVVDDGVHLDLRGCLAFDILGAWVAENPVFVGIERIITLVYNTKEVPTLE